MTGPGARFKVLVVLAASAVCAGGTAVDGDAAAASSADCRAVAAGPFLYAGMVFPDGAVECSGAVSRIRVSGVLTRDGVAVESARRDCRNTSACRLSVDLAHVDSPGDQRWCARISGSVAGGSAVPEATVCEEATF
jgi:hypothetical protein